MPLHINRVSVAVMVLLLAGGLTENARAQAGANTLDELILYAVNNDPPVRLVRYEFNSPDSTVVCELIDQNGNRPEEVESLAYVASGPDKGFYGTWNINDSYRRTRLMKIDPLTGETYTYPVNVGFGSVVGMVAIHDPFSREWILAATSRGWVNNTPPRKNNLIVIDPVTGVGALVKPLTNIESYQGLALSSDRELYAVTTGASDKALYIIDPLTGSETKIGDHGFGKIESLEFAFGDSVALEIPGVPLSWTQNGALIGFDDPSEAFVVFNPADGSTMVVGAPFLGGSVGGSVGGGVGGGVGTDLAGLVFLTRRNDPRYFVDEGHD